MMKSFLQPSEMNKNARITALLLQDHKVSSDKGSVYLVTDALLISVKL